MRLRAFAIPTLIRFLSVASYGELRHWNSNGPGRYSNDTPTTVFHPSDDDYGSMRSLSREQVYHDVFTFPFDKIEVGLTTLVVDYTHPGWKSKRKHYPPPNLTSREKRKWDKRNRIEGYAYGGPKWSEVAQSTLTLLNTYNLFVHSPTSTTWANLVIAANNAIHTAHNGGFALSKWVQDDDFHNIAIAPGWGFISPVAAQIAVGLLDHDGAK